MSGLQNSRPPKPPPPLQSQSGSTASSQGASNRQGNIKASFGDCKAPGSQRLLWVTELTRSACAKPPGSGGSAAPHTCLPGGRRNYNSQDDPEEASAAEWSFKLCGGPALNLENAAGAPGKVLLLKKEDGAESLETIYKEAECQGDPSQSGTLGGGDRPRVQPAGLRYLPLPQGASLRGSPLPGLPWSQHYPGEGGVRTLGSGYLMALVGSIVKEVFPSS